MPQNNTLVHEPNAELMRRDGPVFFQCNPRAYAAQRAESDNIKTLFENEVPHFPWDQRILRRSEAGEDCYMTTFGANKAKEIMPEEAMDSRDEQR